VTADATQHAPLTLKKLEQTIADERAKQREHLSALDALKEQNAEAQVALSDELERLRALSAELGKQQSAGAFSRKLRNLIAKFPGMRGRILTQRSIEELLRAQYEASVLRLKQAGELADRLTIAKADLHKEVERLDGAIVGASEEELRIAAKIEALDAENDAARRALLVARGVDVRRLEAAIDRREHEISDLKGQRRLHSSADERLAVLKRATQQLAGTIGQLQLDMTHYVTAAGEKLDLLAGQIRAVGAAADAALIVLELKSSIEALTESTNQATRFVAETSAYLRDNVDRMVEDLQVFDAETERVLRENAAVVQLQGELGAEVAARKKSL